MRALTMFTATLAFVVGASFAAQAATITVTADQATYNVSDTITLTIVGDVVNFGNPGFEFDSDGVLVGFLSDANGNASWSGVGASTNQLQGQGAWGATDYAMSDPSVITNIAFGALFGTGDAQNVLYADMTSVMTFHAESSGTADFSWLVTGSNALNFFGITSHEGISVTIVPEPTTAGLMGLGLIGLVIAGRRR